MEDKSLHIVSSFFNEMRRFFEMIDAAPEYILTGKAETMDIVFKMAHREFDYDIQNIDYSKLDLHDIMNAIDHFEMFQDEDTISEYSGQIDNYQNLIHVSADLYLIQRSFSNLLNKPKTSRRFI